MALVSFSGGGEHNVSQVLNFRLAFPLATEPQVGTKLPACTGVEGTRFFTNLVLYMRSDDGRAAQSRRGNKRLWA
jgi:hypothetical protein